MTRASGDVYLDFQGLAQLRADAGRKPSPEATAKVAEQFEAVFLQMMLKSMRQASLGEGLFDSDQTKLYQEMFDQQIALDMAKKRQAGIADAMLRQLQGAPAAAPGGESLSGQGGEAAPLNHDQLQRRVANFTLTDALLVRQSDRSAPPAATTAPLSDFDSPDDFVAKLWPMAQKYGAALGVEPQVLVAQAALETGWGQAVSRTGEGASTHNLFNIKADERWDGPRAVVATLEYEAGIPQRQFATFRAYDSFEASFADYVDFLRSSPRYQPALERAADSAAYIQSLQGAGYATDPDYAAKVIDIMRREALENAASGANAAAVDGPLLERPAGGPIT